MNKKIITVLFILSLLVIFPIITAGLFDWLPLGNTAPQQQQINYSNKINIYDTNNYNINKKKFTGLEKYLIDEKIVIKNKDNIIIKLKINQTVLAFFKSTYNNPTMNKCLILQKHIKDDYPNFDCYNANHRTILLNKLSKLKNGLKLIRDGINKGYTNISNGYVILTIPKNNLSKRGMLEIGENSLSYNYEKQKEVIFSIDENHNISAKLFWDINGDGSNWNNTINDLFVSFNKTKWKFGATHNGSLGIERYKYILEFDKKPYSVSENEIVWKDCENDYYGFGSVCNVTVQSFEDLIYRDFETNSSYKYYSDKGLFFYEITFLSDKNIDPVLTQGNVSGCGEITSSGTYTLNQSITGLSTTCIKINASNVLLDGGDFIIEGNNGYNDFAIEITDTETNITIQNINLREWENWIKGITTSNSFLYNVTGYQVRTANSYGIQINSNVIANSLNLSGGTRGARLFYFNTGSFGILNNSVLDCNNQDGATGVYVGYKSSDNNYTNNNILNCDGGINIAHVGKRNIYENNIFYGNNPTILISGSSSISASYNKFYNNIFNDTIPMRDDVGSGYPLSIFNTTPSNERNILGKDVYGGNYWGNGYGTGFSDFCTVREDTDYICENGFDVANAEECTSSCTGYNYDEYPLTNNFKPEIIITSPENTTYTSNITSILYNITILIGETNPNTGNAMPSNVTDIAFSGDVPWTNVANALIDSDSAAESSGSREETDDLDFTDYKMFLPSVANITGIETTLKIREEGGFDVITYQLLKNGVASGTNHVNYTIPSTFSNYTEGGQNDLWGLTWTPEELNNNSFGVRVRGDSSNGDNTMWIAWLKVKVYYSLDNQCFYTTDGGITNTSTSCNGAVTGLQLGEPTNTVRVTTIDYLNQTAYDEVTFVVTGEVAGDTEYPIFTNIDNNNGSLIDSGTVIINSTITSTNGSAGVEFDGINYTATNISDLFDVSFSKSPAGVYSYFWWAYGNGTDTLFNNSQTYSYTINATVVDNVFPLINFTNPTNATGSIIYVNHTLINISIDEENLKNISFNWDNNNFSLFDDSLVLFYNFDNRSSLGENDSLVKDLSGNGNDGIANLNPTWSSNGKYYGEYSFDGNDTSEQSISIPNNAMNSNDGNLTICQWAKRNGSPSPISYGFSLRSNLNTRLYFAWGSSGQYSQINVGNPQTTIVRINNIDDGKWVQMCLVYEKINSTHTSYTGYLNYNQSNSNVIVGGNQQATKSSVGGNEQSFNGSTDDVIIFNRSLSSEEIKQLYDSSLTKYNNTNWGLVINESSLDYGLYNYSASVCDDNNNCNSTEVRNINVTKPIDLDYPIFTSEFFDIANGSLYGEANIYTSYQTITSTNTTAGIEFNGLNYSSIHTLGLYSSVVGGLGAGVYPYFWWAYGNGTDTNFNKSQQYYYTVLKNNDSSLSIAGTTPIDYGTITDVVGSNCPSQLSCSIDKPNIIYGAGTETFNYSTNGNENYTADSIIKDIIINPITPITNMGITGTTPIEYGTISDILGSETNINDTDCLYSIDKPNIIYGAGTETFNYSTGGCQNYTAGSITMDLIINKNNSYDLGLTGTTPIEYMQTTNFIGSNCPSQISCSLNITNEVYGAGDVWANYSTDGNNNYTANYTEFKITINKNNSYDLGLTGTTPITYGTPTDFIGSNCPTELSCGLNITNQIYKAGNTWANYSTNGNSNYTANYTEFTILINKANGIVYTYIDNNRNNKSSNNATIINITGVLSTGIGNINLTVNGNERVFGISPLINLSIYTSGTYVINTSYLGNENYTKNSESWTLTITNTTIISTLYDFFAVYNEIISNAYKLFSIDSNGNTNATNNLSVGGQLSVMDLSTGSNTGSSICIDANNKLCACGSCA